MDLLRKLSLVRNDDATDSVDMVVVAMLLAPVMVASATMVERRLGPSAAGWLVALPVGFAIAEVAVGIDGGGRTASTMALSAAAHVPAQLCFAVVFAGVLTRRGLLVGLAAGAVAYLVASLVIAPLPALLAVALAIPAFCLAPRMIAASRPQVGSPRPWPTTAMTCVAASVVVAAAVLTSRVAGPAMAGAVAAFPTVTTTLAVAVVARDGCRAGAHVCVGLTRSLPCYLTFCVVVVATEPRVGLFATGVAVLGCAITCRLTWRSVPLAPTPRSALR
jgi:hypothetical protein